MLNFIWCVILIAACVTIASDIYVIGGEDTNDADYILTYVDVYNMKSKLWRKVSSMINYRSFHCAVAVNDSKIYVCGGTDNDTSKITNSFILRRIYP